MSRHGFIGMRQTSVSFVVPLERRREIYLALCYACRHRRIDEWARTIQVGDAVEYDVLADLPGDECTRADVEAALGARGLRWAERFLDEECARVWVVENVDSEGSR